MVLGEHPLAEQIPAQPVDVGAEGLDQVRGQGFPAMGRLVVEADIGVQSRSPEGLHGFAVEQCVSQRKNSVDGIAGRTAVAPGKLQRRWKNGG